MDDRGVRRDALRRYAVMVGVLLSLLLIAGCTSGSDSPGVAGASSATRTGQSSSSTVSDKLLAFSRCMRHHGVPKFEDPQPGQTVVKLPEGQPAYGASAAQLTSAVAKCRQLLPPGSNGWYPRSEIPRVLHSMRHFAQCMRDHGISHWPDPSFDSQGRLAFHGPGADNPPGSPTDHAVHQCQHLLPPIVTDLLGG